MNIKRFYPKTEHFVVFLVFIVTVLLIMPFSLENTRQASYISKWNEIYNKVEYMFSVINAHIDDNKIKIMKKAHTPHEREQALLMIIKPYLRINDGNISVRHYRPRFKNGEKIQKDSKYYFDEFYYAKGKTLIGIKNIHTETEKDPLFIMMFDVNGVLLPNRWGTDIFGINIYDGGKVEPFGYDMILDSLKDDCSKTGTGVSCSYYYKIGGGF
ncbi:hypothetical protein II810_01390 [bacterium]|nr:hypothetical protein [bacterium]